MRAMQTGNRFRSYPNPALGKTLLQWIGCQRSVHNAKVREDQYFRSFARKSLQHAGQYAPIDQQYAQFKSELTPWLFDVPSQILRNGAVLWKQAYSRFFAKLGGRPVIHRKHGKQSVWITQELFEFVPFPHPTKSLYRIRLGTARNPIGFLDFHAHHDYQIPNSIHISIHAGRWHVSFNYDNGLPEPTEQETIDYLLQFSESELRQRTFGGDRGVKIPLAGSDGQPFDFSPIQKKRLTKQEKHKKRWQKRLARRVPGSANRLKAKNKVARYQRYGAQVRHDWAHQTSHVLSNDPHYLLFILEALQVRNMTKKAQPKQDAKGRWLKNGARAKAGLNKVILASAWGKTKTFLQYKARRKGKLVIEVPPFYSSQECAACGHIHPDNRISQSGFICLSCGSSDHADHNAAKVIASRGVKWLLSGQYVPKETGTKRCGIPKKKIKVGTEGPEPVAGMRPTPGETKVSHGGGNTPMLWSLTQETPATSSMGL